MFTNDFIMRQIEMLGGALERILGKERKEEKFQIKFNAADDVDEFSKYLDTLVSEGKYCLAEDELFGFVKRNKSKEGFSTALGFYKALIEKTDEDLFKHNFSRDEISQGLTDIFKILNESDL